MTPLPLLVLEAGSSTKFLTISANPTLWTFFGSHKELGGTSMFAYVNIIKIRFHICFPHFVFLFVILCFYFLNHIIVTNVNSKQHFPIDGIHP
jgi:hypothetical protein